MGACGISPEGGTLGRVAALLREGGMLGWAADELAELLRAAGAGEVSYRRLAGGAVVLHVARRG